MNKIEIIHEFNKIECYLQTLIENLLIKCYPNGISVGNIHIDVFTKLLYVEQTKFELNCNIMTSVGERKTKIIVNFDKIEASEHDNFIFMSYDMSFNVAKQLRNYLFDVE